MKIIKMIIISLISFILCFLLVFVALEIFKYTGHKDLFRAHTPYDLKIINARIIDGSGNKIFRGEIGIRDGKIIAVADSLSDKGEKIFDAAGFSVAPALVEWPQELVWVQRDLQSAIKRYPPYRIIIKEAANSAWVGRSVKGILNEENISFEDLQNRKARVFIMPRIEDYQAEDTAEGFYALTAWRSKAIEQKIGKIKEGYPARIIVFNHRKLGEETIIRYLKQEKMPPYDYLLEGNQVQSIK